MVKKIELLAPAGGMANLKGAVAKGADAVYLGMNRFSARDFATNFDERYLKKAVNICKSNDVKLYLAMNTLVLNSEIDDFFNQLSYAYSCGIDSVIIQEVSFLDIIKKNYPDLNVHVSTQAGVMNSKHVNLLDKADRITLARELLKDEIKNIRDTFSKELEMFCHGALCVSMSGQCLFSSLLGGRSGNRGKCAQPCRKKYDGRYYLSTKELCLIEKLPDMIDIGVNAVKIEGRMRTPYYVATVTSVYREAIDSFYDGNFSVSKQMLSKLQGAFSREFTKGWFNNSKDIFNRAKGTGESYKGKKEFYEVKAEGFSSDRCKVNFQLPNIVSEKSKSRNLLVKVGNFEDGISACENGADVVYLDIFNSEFSNLKKKIDCKLFGVTPRIMLDSDVKELVDVIGDKKPDGLFAGNMGVANLGLKIPLHFDYNVNCFNDIDVNYFLKNNMFPIISPELSFDDLMNFRNKNFGVFVHGDIRLMTLRHELKNGVIKDERGGLFRVNKIRNGSEVLNNKEMGLFSRCHELMDSGINNFFIDHSKNVSEIVSIYRKILDGQKVNDNKIKKNYVLGWSFKGVI